MKNIVISLTAALVLTAGVAQAAGHNRVTADGTPLRWDMSNGPIPVYTDGGEAFTYDYDGSVFLSIERADEITRFAFDQWSSVPTSTFEAVIAGTIEDAIGIADVTGANADQIYFQPNGYGIWVLYDTDASILEDFFGVSRHSTLGIAFPEFALSDGTIIEATAVLNGWNVHVDDVNGDRVAGVFTHEFGHTVNLGHSQVNGHLANYSSTRFPLHAGVAGCGSDPVFAWNHWGPGAIDPNDVEAMYPTIRHTTELGRAMSYVTTSDDIAAISNLYPTDDYLASTGTISGTLRLKDGKTDYSGINVIARNVDDPTGDAVSALTGHETLGVLGPDGRFTIRGLTPGEQYVVHTERIISGAFPVPTAELVSVAEYWNTAEGTDPIADDPCDATPILAEAGVTKNADLYFNGYTQGIDFTPLGPFYLIDITKNGKSTLGYFGSIPFTWNAKSGYTLIPGASATGGAISRNGQKIATGADVDGNGILTAAVWDANGGMKSVGYLGEVECAGTAQAGPGSSSSWDISADGKTVVGLAYHDKNGDGQCETQRLDPPEIVGFVWTERDGMRELPIDGLGRTPNFIRAHNISGNGKVILGGAGHYEALAWVNGELVDLYRAVGATSARAVNHDGTRVALTTPDGVVLWDPTKEGDAGFEHIGGLEWCVDKDYIWFGVNYCDLLGAEYVQSVLGPIEVGVNEMSDDGRVMIGRGGSFFDGFVGAIWLEPLGWMTWETFLSRQGVTEAENIPFNNPIAISASGSEVVGGVAGAQHAWQISIQQVFVCENGVSVQTGFPNGLFDKLAQGAEFGRCEHID